MLHDHTLLRNLLTIEVHFKKDEGCYGDKKSEVATGGAQFVGLQKQLWDKPQWRTSVQFF